MTDAVVLRATSLTGPRTPDWRRSTSRALIEAFEEAAAWDFARALRKETPFAELARRSMRPDADLHRQALWSQHAFPGTDRSRALAALLADARPAAGGSRKSRERRATRIADLLDRFRSGPEPDGFEVLACQSLLLHEPNLADDLCLRLWRTVWSWMQGVLETPPQLAGRLTADQRAVWLGELPWAYGSMFSMLRGARQARAFGAEQLQRELSYVCDEDGIPHAALLERLPLCVAPFVRATKLGDVSGDDWRKRESRRRFKRLVVRSAALLQPDGRTALSDGDAPAAAALVLAACGPVGLKKSHRAAVLAAACAGRTRLGVKDLRRMSAAPRWKRKHRPAAQSDAAHLAQLRNNWGVGADTCTIAFADPTPQIALTAFGTPVLSGGWAFATGRSAGERHPRAAKHPWECVCWFSESTADYVELQCVPERGGRLLRQVLLSRDDHFALVCDIAETAGDAGIEHTLTLPLVAGASAEQDALTREWRLQCGPLTARVIPLGLPQDTVHRADGSLTIDARGITLQTTASGSRLASLLLVDWSPARRQAPVQWKSLTVAENGRTVTAAEALGVRWRIGDAQWLYYHALTTGQTARTVLGHHTFHETVIAEVDSNGDVQQIVEVENPALN